MAQARVASLTVTMLLSWSPVIGSLGGTIGHRVRNGAMKPKKVAALEGVIDESRGLFADLQRAIEEIHGDLGLTPGIRDLLRQLREQGPATVPEIARAREVSRQHVQSVVNRLDEEGLVELADNPKHRRSRIVQLTPTGRQLVNEMDRREERVWRTLGLGVKRRELKETADVLARVRLLLTGDDWRRAVAESRATVEP